MGIALFIVFGALAGWIATAIMGSNDSLVMNIVIGVVGAVVGGWLMSIIGSTGVTGFNLYSLLVAVLGAIVLIAVARAFRHA